MEMIRLFVGHDSREKVAYSVFCESVIDRCTLPVSIVPLSLKTLENVYDENHSDGSNAFIYSRFLVPHLCDYSGWAIFADGDMLCLDDLAELWEQRDYHTAVQVVKHDYKTKHPMKYLGAKNENYPRKNWSSLILWNCGHPANMRLSPQFVDEQNGAYLHRFAWLDDKLIGGIHQNWNWLVDEYDFNPYAKLVHFTLGTPCFSGYEGGEYARRWYAELTKAMQVPLSAPCYNAALAALEKQGKRK